MDVWCLPLQLCGGFWGEQSQPSWKHLRGCWVPPALGSLGCRRTEDGDVGDPRGEKPPGFWWHLLINAVGPARFPGHPLWAGFGVGTGLWGGLGADGAPLVLPAAGSRVSQELRYTKEKLGEESVYTSQMLIQTPKREGENILTQEALQLHLEAAVAASKVQVSLYGK